MVEGLTTVWAVASHILLQQKGISGHEEAEEKGSNPRAATVANNTNNMKRTVAEI